MLYCTLHIQRAERALHGTVSSLETADFKRRGRAFGAAFPAVLVPAFGSQNNNFM
jgi:hypothetical protein